MRSSWTALARELGQGLLHVLYPPVCNACGCSLPPLVTDFCGACRSALTTDPFPACPRCAGTVGPFVNLDGGCTQCRGATYQFDGASRLGPFVGLLADLIKRIKYGGSEGLAEAMGGLWAEHSEQGLRARAAEVVIPVPLHWRKRLGRGFNQSEVLARALARRIGVPCRPRWLRRVRHTPPQTRQTATDRRTNVRDAFRARSVAALKGKTVLLVDDVLTTGSTCNDAARALRAAGAARVFVAVLAHSQQ